MGLFTNTPVASGPILPDPSWWMQRDFTRKYHAQVFQQELAFRERLAHLYASSSRQQLLQQDFNKSSNQKLQQEYSTNLQWNSSKSPDSVLPKQPGWSSFCEVDSKTEVFEKCNFIDKKVLMSKELKEGSDNGIEENSEQQRTQTEQQQQERDISDDLEKQEKSRKNDSIPFNECQRSLKSNQLTTEECLTCNKVFKSQKDFESHLAGRKHAKQLSQRIIHVKALSEVKDGSKKCENAGEEILMSIDSGLLVKDNVEKRSEKELVEKVKYNGDLVAKEDNVGMKENAELNEQQQIMVGAMPSKPWSSNYVTGDEQKCSENEPVWKVRDDKDLGPKINEVDMKENAELIDQHQMKEGNSKQQKVQIDQHLTEDSSKQQNLQIEQQMVEGGMPSLKSNQSTTKECVSCNKVFKSQDDFKSHLAGKKHAKQLLKRITCVKALSEVKGDSKKCENAGEEILMSIDPGLLVKDNVEKRSEKELVEKVKYNGDLVAKEDNVGMKENAELNEQQQIMVGAMPSKPWSSNYVTGDEQKCSENEPVWKVRDDKDLGPKINEVDMKENAELIDQHQMKEGNSKQQKVQIDQHLTEDSSKQQNLQIEQQMVEGGMPSLKSNQSTTKECVSCNKVFKSQDDFKSHLAGKKHAKQLLKRITCVKALSEVKGDSKKCENAGEEILMSIDPGLLVKDNVEKRSEKELVEKVKYNGDLVAKEDNVGMKENAELNEQQQIMVGAMPSKPWSSNYVTGDEQKCSENEPVWKVRDDKDLGPKINEVDMKENAELIDQHQMKEGNSKQQKVQIDQHLTEDSSKQQNLQIEQQMVEGGMPSLKSNQSTTKECVSCNKVFKSQDDFKSHLAGKKHAKQLLKRITCVKALSEVKGDSKKCENAGEEILMSIDPGLLVKDNVEKRSEKELVEKVKYNGDLVAKEDNVGMKENAELNEQQQIMVGAMPSKPWSSNYVTGDEQKCSENEPVWKVRDDKDLGPKINEVDMKENAELIDQHQMKEGNSKQQKVQIDQHLTEDSSKQQNLQIEQQMVEGGMPSLKSNQSTTKECVSCNKVFKSQDDFKSHLAGKKHAKQLLKRITCVKALSEVKGDSKKCENAGEEILMSIDPGLLVKDNVEKRSEKELVEKVKYNGDLVAKEDNVGMKENAELNEQQQIMVGAMPSKPWSSNYVTGDEQKCSENEPVWKVRDDKDLGPKINEVDMKENAELIDQHQMKEGNSKQQKVQIDQHLTEDSSKQQNLQIEQQMVEGGMPSLKSNQSTTKECVSCNKVFKSQDDFKSHLAGKKHAKQLLKRITCVKALSEVKGDSKKCENAGEEILMSIDPGLLVKDNVEKRSEKELVEKVKYNGDLVAKEDNVGMKENAELNEQQQIMVGAMPSKPWSSNYVTGDEQKCSENEPVWKVRDDKDLGPKINEVDMKENAELIDQHQMKEGNSKQQKVQIDQHLTEDSSKQQNLQIEQQMVEGGMPSLKSNQSTTQECVSCNKVFKSQDDFKSHLAGKKHAKQLLKRITCVKALSEVKGDSKKCENAGEEILMSIDPGLLVKDNVEKRSEKELVEKVKYNGDLVAKEDNVGMKENAELNEQQQIMVGAMPSKLWSSNYVTGDEQKCSENESVWKVRDDKDLGPKINEVDMKENAELIDQHQMKEGNSKQQKVQIDQHLTEDSSKQQNLQIEQQMVEGGMPSLKSNQSRTEECVAFNKVFKSQDDFKSHLAGKKRAKQLLERITCVKALSEVKGDSKKCENAGEEILMSIDSGLLVKDNVEKRSEKELVEKVRYNGDLVAKENKVGMKDIAELYEQQQIMVGAMPSKLCKRSSNLSELRIKNCKISYVKGDEQKNSENKPVWKAKDDKDLGAKINEVDMKENAELIDQHQMKEGNSKQQRVQIEQQMTEGNSKQQSPQMEQQMTEGNLKQQSSQMEQQMTEGNSKQPSLQMEQQMVEGGTPPLKSNQSRTKECVACNRVFNSQEDFKSHLAGRKHAKQGQRRKCIKVLSEVKDDSKKCENAGEKILMSIDFGLPVKHDMEKRLEKELAEKVKYNGDLVAKEDKVGVKDNPELNEQQQIMVGAMPSKLCKSSSNLSVLSVKNCKISYVKGDEQKSSENKPVWKAKDDKDLGSKINKVDMKENAELIDQHQMTEGNSKQKKLQIDQQMIEGHSKQQNPQMEQQMMEGGTPSLKSNQLRTEECVTCNRVFNSQDDFKSHLAGKKHAKQLLQRITCVKALSEVKDDSKRCENAGEKILISIDSGLLVKDNMEKRLQKELAEKVRYNGDLVTKEDKVGTKENAELNEQQQIMVGAMPSNLCKRSSNLSELSIENCKLSYVKCDEQKSSENKPVWKAKYDKDLGAKISEVDMKENAELIDQHQMKEGISKQQKVQIEQQIIEGNSKQQKPQMEQQMMEGETTSKEYGGSLNSNPLKIKECVICNIALQVQDAFEAHLSGRKHAKQLKKMETKVVRKVADDSDFDTKSIKVGIKETDEHELEQMNTRGVSSEVCKMLSNARQVSIEECKISKEKDYVDINDKNKLVWKVKDDRNLDAKRNRVDMKENAELNEQCVLKEGNSEQQNFQSEQKMNEGKSKQQKLQMEEQMKEENSKTQKLQMKQQIMENGLRNKQHERLTSEQLKVNGYMMCNTALNFQGDSEAELARRKHAKQLKKMENKLVWKVTDKRDLCSKTNNFGMKETTELSEKQHMKETAELSEKQHMKKGCMLSKICKNSSNGSKLSIKEFKVPITKDKVDKGAINQSVWKVDQQQWMMKTNTKQHNCKQSNSYKRNIIDNL